MQEVNSPAGKVVNPRREVKEVDEGFDHKVSTCYYVSSKQYLKWHHDTAVRYLSYAENMLSAFSELTPRISYSLEMLLSKIS